MGRHLGLGCNRRRRRHRVGTGLQSDHILNCYCMGSRVRLEGGKPHRHCNRVPASSHCPLDSPLRGLHSARCKGCSAHRCHKYWNLRRHRDRSRHHRLGRSDNRYLVGKPRSLPRPMAVAPHWRRRRGIQPGSTLSRLSSIAVPSIVLQTGSLPDPDDKSRFDEPGPLCQRTVARAWSAHDECRSGKSLPDCTATVEPQLGSGSGTIGSYGDQHASRSVGTARPVGGVFTEAGPMDGESDGLDRRRSSLSG